MKASILFNFVQHSRPNSTINPGGSGKTLGEILLWYVFLSDGIIGRG